MFTRVAFAAGFCLLAACMGQSYAKTWYVEPNATGEVASIQAAIDAAAQGDTVLLANGSYRQLPVGNRDVDFKGKAVVVRSLSGNPALCIINCGGSQSDPHYGFIFDSGEGAGSVLQDVTITGGFNENGGALTCAAGAAPTIRGCRFINNGATFLGGAIYCTGNGSSPLIVDCEFIGNSALTQFGGTGGAVGCEENASPSIDDSYFSLNNANAGGAIHCIGTEVTISGCRFVDNTGVFQGGAADVGLSAAATFDGCVFTWNSAPDGSVVSGVRVQLINCTMSFNWSNPSGAAVSCDVNRLTRSIISYSIQGKAVLEFCDSAIVECTNVIGNPGGDWIGCMEEFEGVNGNLSVNPMFCDAANRNFTLASFSECRPENNSCGVLIGAEDGDCPTPTGIRDRGPSMDSPLVLRVFPNPFNPSTTIQCQVSGAAFVAVYDVRGRLVKRFVREHGAPGRFSVVWDGSNDDGAAVASGTYLVRVVSGGSRATAKAILLK